MHSKQLSELVVKVVNFTCDQCGRVYMFRRVLDRHVRRNHTDHPVFDCSQYGRSFIRHGNSEKHERNCTRGVPAAKRQCVAVPVAGQAGAPEF